MTTNKRATGGRSVPESFKNKQASRQARPRVQRQGCQCRQVEFTCGKRANTSTGCSCGRAPLGGAIKVSVAGAAGELAPLIARPAFGGPAGEWLGHAGSGKLQATC